MTISSTPSRAWPVTNRFAGPLELGHEVPGPFDGTGQHLGEERHVDGEDERRTDRLVLPPVDVDDVADGLEDVEGEAHRQGQAQGPVGGTEPQRPGHVAEGVDEEVEVLELGQDEQRRATAVPATALRVKASSTTARRRPAP